MLALLRQPLLKSVKIAQFGGKQLAQPIPRVLKKSYKSYSRRGYPGYGTGSEYYINIRPSPGPSVLEHVVGYVKVVLMWPIFVSYYFVFKWGYEGYKEYKEEQSKKPEM